MLNFRCGINDVLFFSYQRFCMPCSGREKNYQQKELPTKGHYPPQEENCLRLYYFFRETKSDVFIFEFLCYYFKNLKFPGSSITESRIAGLTRRLPCMLKAV